MANKSYNGNARRTSKPVAAVQRRPGTDRNSTDPADPPRPGTSYGPSRGNRGTASKFAVQRPQFLPKDAIAAKPEIPGRTTQIDANGLYKKSIKAIAFVMDGVAQHTFFSGAKVLLNVLVNAETENRAGFSRVMDYIVEKAIAEQTRSNLYAHLCSEAYRKSLVDPRDEVRTAFCETFKRELVNACDNVLRAAGISNRARPDGQFDGETRKRTLGACRFLGELYTANIFKIFAAVKANVDAFMRARDERSLECLSVLMIVIGSKFEKVKVEESATEWTARKIYVELRKIASCGCANNNALPPRTIMTLDRLLILHGKHNARTKSSAISNDVAKAREDNVVTHKSTRAETSTAPESGDHFSVAPAYEPATAPVVVLTDAVKTTEAHSVTIRKKRSPKKRNTGRSTTVVQRPPEVSKNTASVPETSQRICVASSVKNAKPNNNTVTNSNELLIQSVVAAVIENVTQYTVSESSRVLFDILVKANETKNFKFGILMNYIVQKAIDDPEKSHLYACLCAETNKYASEDSRDSVRNKFTIVLKAGLLRSCNIVLSEAGIRNYARPRGPAAAETKGIPNSVVDHATTRVRTLQTCRFMGHLFTTKVFKMHNVVTRTVDALLKARDEHFLECACALLTIVGPRFELVEHAAVLSATRKVYEELQRLAVAGYKENTMSMRTIKTINNLLRVRNNDRAKRKPIFPQDLVDRWYQNRFVKNVEHETYYRERLPLTPRDPYATATNNNDSPFFVHPDDKRGNECNGRSRSQDRK